MKRRDFLKYASALGASTSMFGSSMNSAFAAAPDYNGPLWITIHAEGGWDPTSFCDPKGYNGPDDANNPARINNYDRNDIKQIGNFNIAPPPNSFLAGQENFDENLYSAETFFSKYAQQLLVVNGIDGQTNSHSNGKLHTWTGALRTGFPGFAGLAAGTLAPLLPLSYLINGGYSYPANLVVPTRMDSRGLAALYEIAFPNRSVSANNSNSATYFSDTIRQLIEKTSNDRITRLKVAETLPRVSDALLNLETARLETRRLENFTSTVDAFDAKTATDFNDRTNAFNFYKQSRLVLSAFQAGVTCSANIRMGGFDTHGDHDARHYPRLMDLLMGIDGLIQEAELRGLADRIVLVIGSELGRTNKYNDKNGKDHWPVTSMMLMGNSVQQIAGNRVIGATNDIQKSVNINPVTLAPDFSGSDVNSIRLTPAYIHQSLRALAGIEQSNNALRFPLDGSNINLFSA